jgi:hypothetical protein
MEKTLQTFLDEEGRDENYEDWKAFRTEHLDHPHIINMCLTNAQSKYIKYLLSVIKQKEEEITKLQRLRYLDEGIRNAHEEELLKANKDKATLLELVKSFMDKLIKTASNHEIEQLLQRLEPYKAKINSSEIPNSSKEITNEG